MEEEGDSDDFPSAFICLPAFFPETTSTLMSIPFDLHVIVVVAGSGTNTAQVSNMGEMKDNC